LGRRSRLKKSIKEKTTTEREVGRVVSQEETIARGGRIKIQKESEGRNHKRGGSLKKGILG